MDSLTASQVLDLLDYASALDPRIVVTDRVVQAWRVTLGPVDPARAAEAIRVHYRTSRAQIMPADVVEHATARPSYTRERLALEQRGMA